MTQSAIAPLIPNLGGLNEAMAGAQSIIFTAADRQIIKEIAGEINESRSFKEIFFKKDITHKVENEQTTVKPEQEIRAFENQRDKQQRPDRSPDNIPNEQVEISSNTDSFQPEELDENISPEKVETQTRIKINQETAAIIQELNLDPAELHDKFALEQQDLHNLVYRIKEMHFKRLMSTSRKEFEELTEKIRKETLAAGRPEAREWLEAQLDTLTQDAAEYKSKLKKSMESVGLCGSEE